MATIGTNHSILFTTDICPPETKRDEGYDTPGEVQEKDGNVFRGFFFAMLFNLVMLLTGAAAWALWRITR
jgi:hypothetical protein